VSKYYILISRGFLKVRPRFLKFGQKNLGSNGDGFKISNYIWFYT